MHIITLFSQFIREKTFLNGISPRTAKAFLDCQRAYVKHIGDELPTKLNLKEFVIKLQESGIAVTTINYYIRSLNSFLTWMVENEYLSEKLRVKPLKEPEKILKTFSEDQLRVLITWKPKDYFSWRIYTLIILIIDTGIRINEALELTRDNVLLDNLLIKVVGKGNKERYIPISTECRKILFKFLNKHSHQLVFATRDGRKLQYFNTLRYFKNHCRRLGITGVRCSWHTLRHTFATSYIRDGGNVFYLQRLLGHSDLTTTKIYVRSQTEDLQLMHKKTSIVGRLK